MLLALSLELIIIPHQLLLLDITAEKEIEIGLLSEIEIVVGDTVMTEITETGDTDMAAVGGIEVETGETGGGEDILLIETEKGDIEIERTETGRK